MDIREIYTFPGCHSAAAKCVVALPDGRVASGSFDGSVKLWSRSTWRQDGFINMQSTVYSMCLLKDGSLAIACGDHNVHVVSVDGQKLTRKRTLGGHSSAVFAVASFVDASGNEIVASGSRDHSIRLHIVASGELIAVLKGHADSVTDLCALSASMIASASSDKTVKVWDLVTGTPILSLAGHTMPVLSLAALSGARLASGDEGGQIRVWDLMAGGRCEEVLDARATPSSASSSAAASASAAARSSSGHAIWSLVTLPSDFLASAGEEGCVRVWDTISAGCIASYTSKYGPIHSLDVIKQAGSTTASVAAAMAIAASSTTSITTDAKSGESSPPASAGLGTICVANYSDFSISLLSIPGSAMIPSLNQKALLSRRHLLEVEQTPSTEKGLRVDSLLSALKKEGSVFGNLLGGATSSSASAPAPAAASAANANGTQGAKAHDDDDDEESDIRGCERLDAPARAAQPKGAAHAQGSASGPAADAMGGGAAGSSSHHSHPIMRVADTAEKDTVFEFPDASSPRTASGSGSSAAALGVGAGFSASATSAGAGGRRTASSVEPLAGLDLEREVSSATISRQLSRNLFVENLDTLEKRIAEAGGVADAETVTALIQSLNQTRAELEASRQAEKASQERIHELISVVSKQSNRLDTYEKQVRDLTNIAMGAGRS